jgi:GMP synthase (glutamine-hydrolysing)
LRVLHLDALDGPLRAFVRPGLAPLGADPIVTIDPREALPDIAGFDAVVITGSEAGVNDPLPWIAPLEAWIRALPNDMPMLGVCFGHQVIAHAFGAPVVPRPPSLRAVVPIELEDPAFGRLGRAHAVVAHQDHVVALPAGFVRVATSDYTPIQAMRHERRPWWTVQFHPDFGREAVRADEAEGHAEWAAYADEQLDAASTAWVLERFARFAR